MRIVETYRGSVFVPKITLLRSDRRMLKTQHEALPLPTVMIAVMAGVNCVVYLIALQAEKKSEDVLKLLVNDSDTISPIVKARPHGWVQGPRKTNKENLTGHDWDLFLLTETSTILPRAAKDIILAHVSIGVTVTTAQYNALRRRVKKTPTPMLDTPPLPQEWPGEGGIPQSAIDFKADTNRDLRSGELKLDENMSHFLSSALPPAVRNTPVSLFNLFKYPSGDSSVHDAYMEGFKEKFGDAAGATVKFMGPVKGSIDYHGQLSTKGKGIGDDAWQDANLVQYDTIWHYAYMLSTEVYQKLNKEKMDGLEDTCILCLSEVEFLQ